MLARDIARACPVDVELIARDHAQLDVRDMAAISKAMEESKPDWLFNCSAFTDVEAVTRDRAEAFAVNGDAVSHMAQACLDAGARMLHFSTDYVFDGEQPGFYSETDTPRPVNAYGESKLAGEEALQRSGADHLLIRTQWLFGMHRKSFAGHMCERAKARQATRVVDDEFGCCTYTVDLAQAAWKLIEKARGTLHVANRGRLSRYTIAERIFDHFGVSALLTPCTSAEFGSATRRPANSPLSVTRAERLLGRTMPPWREALDRYLAERRRAGI